MKQWETPKVVIDKFIPNQYVSVCTVPVTNTFRYIDLADPQALDLFFYRWGVGDGEHQSRENVSGRAGNTVSFQGSGDYARYPLENNTWYTGITIYSGYSLFGGNYNGPQGTFDVYVTGSADNWTAAVYTQGSAAAETTYHKDPVNHS